MMPWTLLDIERALRDSLAADTCSPDDLARADWDPANPGLGSLRHHRAGRQELFGGDLMLGKVYAADGGQQGFH